MLEDRVVIVTGAGRGIGRAHALYLAQHGAQVIVNDLSTTGDGSGSREPVAEMVAEEIRSHGGQAVADTSDVAEASGAESLLARALDAFGRVDGLVNNAGILRDRTIVNMSDDEWDSVVRVHLRGHFMPLRALARYWRHAHKGGHSVNAAVVNTTSTSGLFHNFGQANYGAAKAGIASLTVIAHKELLQYGVRVNAIAPAARTRLTAKPSTDHPDDRSDTGSRFDFMSPTNISPLAAYLVGSSSNLSGKTFFVAGDAIYILAPYSVAKGFRNKTRWSLEQISAIESEIDKAPFEPGFPPPDIAFD
jgi:NAD(P)-dependent dehydrogenase (short-subunit alcohol dehydrogenase family)